MLLTPNVDNHLDNGRDTPATDTSDGEWCRFYLVFLSYHRRFVNRLFSGDSTNIKIQFIYFWSNPEILHKSKNNSNFSPLWSWPPFFKLKKKNMLKFWMLPEEFKSSQSTLERVLSFKVLLSPFSFSNGVFVALNDRTLSIIDWELWNSSGGGHSKL